MRGTIVAPEPGSSTCQYRNLILEAVHKPSPHTKLHLIRRLHPPALYPAHSWFPSTHAPCSVSVPLHADGKSEACESDKGECVEPRRDAVKGGELCVQASHRIGRLSCWLCVSITPKPHCLLTFGSSYSFSSSFSSLCLSSMTLVVKGPTMTQLSNCGTRLARISSP